MESTIVPENWSRAYARQALSDLRAREALVESTVDRCHRLHFLQMAAEKTCKAYVSAGDRNRDVKRTHAYVKRILPAIAREFYVERERRTPIPEWLMRKIRLLANEIEVLAPACDAGDVRYDNCEYPWLDTQGIIQIPCDFKFHKIDDDDRALALVIKLLRAAAASWAV